MNDPRAYDVPPDIPLRFNLRGLLIGMTAAAAISAIAGPVYRATPTDAQDELTAFWISALVVAAIFGWRRWRKISRIAHAAGSVRVALVRPDVAASPSSALTLMWAGFLLFGVLLFGELTWHAANAPLSGPILMGCMLSALICWSAEKLWGRTSRRRRAMLLCEHGVVIDARVLPWGGILRYSWGGPTGDWLILSSSRRPYAGLAADVLRQHVETVMREKGVYDGEEVGAGVETEA